MMSIDEDTNVDELKEQLAEMLGGMVDAKVRSILSPEYYEEIRHSVYKAQSDGGPICECCKSKIYPSDISLTKAEMEFSFTQSFVDQFLTGSVVLEGGELYMFDVYERLQFARVAKLQYAFEELHLIYCHACQPIVQGRLHIIGVQQPDGAKDLETLFYGLSSGLCKHGICCEGRVSWFELLLNLGNTIGIPEELTGVPPEILATSVLKVADMELEDQVASEVGALIAANKVSKWIKGQLDLTRTMIACGPEDDKPEPTEKTMFDGPFRTVTESIVAAYEKTNSLGEEYV